MTYDPTRLSDKTKKIIRDAFSEIKDKTPNFKSRPSQLKLIAEVSKVLSGVYNPQKRIVVAEAPTGTGKSIGYSLGAIPVAIEEERKVIISTGTVALQEQLVDRDLPALIEKSGLSFTYELAKGRGRYACNRNIDYLVNEDSNQNQIDYGDGVMAESNWPFEPSKEQRDLVYELYTRLDNETWSGDIDKWDGEKIDDNIKRLITTSSAACTNRECPFISDCPFQLARRRLGEADVIIANHDLVMADVLTLGGGNILTPPDETIYIFDEAHHLPDVALSHGEQAFSFKRVSDELTKTPNLIGAAMGTLKVDPARISEVKNQVIENVKSFNIRITSVKDYISSCMQNIEAVDTGQGGLVKTLRYKGGVADPSLLEVAREFAIFFGKLESDLGKLEEALKMAVKNKVLTSDSISDVLKEVVSHIDLYSGASKAWRLFAEKDHPSKAPHARWFDERDKSGKKTLHLNVCPTSAGELLRTELWERAAGVVLASATVSSMGNFNHFAERAGLSFNDGTQFLKLSSPFNYEDNAVLHIPNMDNEPGNRELHTREVAQYLDRLIDPKQGTLVLFSSRKQMEDVFDLIKPALSLKTLVQGRFSKNEILKKHEDRIKEGEGSIIFGLASFSEGVDLPGKLCEQVFIAKLPFAVPDSPIDATYSEWLVSNRRNPFMEISVPDACVKLIQSCGRLIRTESDSGRVVLLDKRVLTKRYGAQMLDSLPPFKRDF